MSATRAIARDERIADVVGAVARQALQDRRLRCIALLDDGSPEARLAARWLGRSSGEDALIRVTASAAHVESVLQAVATENYAESGANRGGTVGDAPDPEQEVRRLRARLVADALVANPANKTSLLLSAQLPPEPFLPLGDLFASEVDELAGGWSAPPAVVELAQRVGGIAALDAALRYWLEAGTLAGADGLEVAARERLGELLTRARPARMYAVVVPKLGARTLGVDLFE